MEVSRERKMLVWLRESGANPYKMFMSADSNSDGYLRPEELKAVTMTSLHSVIDEFYLLNNFPLTVGDPTFTFLKWDQINFIFFDEIDLN